MRFNTCSFNADMLAFRSMEGYIPSETNGSTGKGAVDCSGEKDFLRCGSVSLTFGDGAIAVHDFAD